MGRRRYRWLALCAGLALLAAVTWWLLTAGDKGAVIAGVLSLTVALLALGADVFGVPWKGKPVTHEGLTDAARSFARQVGQGEAAEQQKFLADAGRGQAANVKFTQPDLVHWRTDGGRLRGTLSDIANYYTSLHHGRLVILGEAGAGKTVLANQLLLDLTSNLPATDPSSGTPLRVPVRLSLPTFDTGSDHANADVLAMRLDAWISGHLTTVYGVAPAMASALVRNGWILPILDGLDEMDPDTALPVRAAAVIRALNYPAGPGPRPLVLTCRTKRYQELIGGTTLSQETILQDVTVVRIQPLTPSQVSKYLIHRFPDPAHLNKIQHRWKPILDHIAKNPNDPLSATLSSPLRLFMAVTAYHSSGTNPARLTNMSSDDLRHHLLESFIPAITSQRPRLEGGIYQPAHVTRWLTTLARYLHSCQTRNEGSGTDIDLSELWRAAGGRAPRYLGASIQALAVAISVLVADSVSQGPLLPHNQGEWTITAAGAAVIVYTAWRASRPPVKLSRLDASQLFASGRRRFAIGFAFGFVVGFSVGFTWGFTTEVTDVPTLAVRVGLFYALAFGVAGGLAGGLADGMAERPNRISHPEELVAQGLAHDIAMWLTFGVAGLIAYGFAGEFLFELAPPGYYVAGFSGGLLFETAFGFTAGLALGGAWIANSPWPRYFIATRILAYQGQLPPHPAHFLDWAYTAGLLRLSGISAQFRHRELQDHLVVPVQIPGSPAPPGPGSHG